jgi:hypothetical protein
MGGALIVTRRDLAMLNRRHLNDYRRGDMELKKACAQTAANSDESPY